MMPRIYHPIPIERNNHIEFERQNGDDIRNFDIMISNRQSCWLVIKLISIPLEIIKNILYVGLHQLFDEFEIKLARCPCLMRPPYNLAAVGLSGNTKLLQMGDLNKLVPVPLKDYSRNIRRILLRYCQDSFVIGAGYATNPPMPFNGHLTINATSSSPENVINNSRIVYEEANTRQRILKIIDDPHQIKCSMLGNLFISEGREGQVIEVRAKGRKSNYDVISLIQNCLSRYFEDSIALGGVLKINGGQVMLHITPENYPERFPTLRDFNRWLKRHEFNCRNLIAIGALKNDSYKCLGQLRNEEPILYMTDSPYKFNIFSDHEAAGQFINDVTPNETEYIGYFNVAKEVEFIC